MTSKPQALTRNQSLVLATLSRVSGPQTAYEILDALRAEGLRAPPQVYRALDKLTELGLAHRLESLNAFVACGEPHAHESGGVIAFAICEKCGHVSEFCDDVVCQRLKDWESRESFTARRTTIEIRGLCKGCAA